MGPTQAISQRDLSRVTCTWGRDVRRHGIVYPVFARDYKVLGILAHSLGMEPFWYGEVPVHAGRGGLRFKAAFQEGGPEPVSATAPELFRATFVCDPWEVVAIAVRAFAREEPRAVPVNVHGQEFQGGTIVDAQFEPTLHRLRAIVVGRGAFRRRTLPVLGMPSLAETIRPVERPKATRLRWPWVQEK